ncbi:MAG: hypothetical protein IPK64_19310 [bacterium]|nr:hypothetical protein [bacterium]
MPWAWASVELPGSSNVMITTARGIQVVFMLPSSERGAPASVVLAVHG